MKYNYNLGIFKLIFSIAPFWKAKMKNIELQTLLKNYPDDIEIVVNHPDGDWYMVPVQVSKYEDEEFLSINTDFKEEG